MVTNTRSRDRESRSDEHVKPIDLPVRGVPNNENDSSDIAIDPLGLHVKEIISTIHRLESLGLQRMDIDLPKCVVLGEQSAGKSSVIEAISGINTPRSDDTCTRCPLYIKLEPSEDARAGWSASVGLRRHFQYDVKPARGKEGRFPGWREMPQPTTIPFATTENPKDLENIIARAQLATISPLVDYQEFLRPSLASLRDHHRCDFSPNIVCISISQPGLPALSFYDLPGIIGQAESGERQFLVEFVRNLVTDYVKDPEALILLCCSLETDIANSTASGIARRLKATDRCIGVLTKPDRLPPGSRHEKLMEVFEQKRFALGHGYFVVKNLGQDEILQGFTHQQARAQEQQFFSGEELWSTTFKSHAHRFGTLNLQKFLSTKLAEQIIKQLPIIEQQIDTRLRQVEADLKQFPEPPTHNASRIISDVILEFSQEVRKEIESEFPYKQWGNIWKALQMSFFKALVSMKPSLRVAGQKDKPVYYDVQAALPGSSVNMPISLSDSEDDDDDDGEDGDLPLSESESPRKKQRFTDPSVLQPPSTPSRRRAVPPPATPVTLPTEDLSALRKIFNLDEVRQHIAENSQSKIPSQIEPRVIKAMMLDTLEHWNVPFDELFATLQQQIKQQVYKLFQKHFQSREGSSFHVESWKIVEQMLHPDIPMARDALADEKVGPHIFHKDLFEQEKAAVLENYRHHPLTTRIVMYKKSKERHTGKPFTAAEEDKLRKNPVAMAVLQREPYEMELGVVAQITTYYMLAARRFHEAVCMRIESKFYKGLCTQLRDELEFRLGLRDDGEGHRNAINLLAESPLRYNQRKELVGQRCSLLQGQKILRDLQHKYGGAGGSIEEKMEGVEAA